MPELPEVETIKNQLQKHLPGLKLKQLEFLDSKTGRFIRPEKLTKIQGITVSSVARRAKMLLLKFNNGHSLAFHLKMTGQVIMKSKETKDYPNKHTRAILYFSQGVKIFFQDMRKFGWLKILKADELITDLLREKLGPEPFGKEFSLLYFQKHLKKSKKPIKVFLLDQSQIAGIGNIYANEALFLAGIHPQLLAQNLTKIQSQRLFQKILLVLKKGIEMGGASDNAYLNAYGKKGQYQNYFLVYRRQDKPCSKCHTMIKRISLGGRGTFFCPQCQQS